MVKKPVKKPRQKRKSTKPASKMDSMIFDIRKSVNDLDSVLENIDNDNFDIEEYYEDYNSGSKADGSDIANSFGATYDRSSGDIEINTAQEASRGIRPSIIIRNIFSALLLLGAVAFYFGLIQPFILVRVSAHTADKVNIIDDHKSKVVDQMKEFQSNIGNKISSNNEGVGVCSTSSKYLDINSDESDLATIVGNLDIADTLLTDSGVYGLTYNPIKDLYIDYSGEYIKAVNEMKIDVNNLKGVLSYLEYRNIWIEGCEELQSSVDYNSIDRVCKRIEKNTLEFLDGSSVNFLSGDIEVEINDLLRACDVFYVDNDVFVLSDQFDNSFDSIMSYNPSLNGLSKAIESLQAIDTVDTLDSIENTVVDKKSIQGMMYLLNLNMID